MKLNVGFNKFVRITYHEIFGPKLIKPFFIEISENLELIPLSLQSFNKDYNFCGYRYSNKMGVIMVKEIFLEGWSL